MKRKITHIATNMQLCRFSYKVAIFIVLKIENFRNIDHLIFSYNYQRKTNSALMGTLCPFVVHVRITSTLISDTEITFQSTAWWRERWLSVAFQSPISNHSVDWMAGSFEWPFGQFIFWKKTPKITPYP